MVARNTARLSGANEPVELCQKIGDNILENVRNFGRVPMRDHRPGQQLDGGLPLGHNLSRLFPCAAAALALLPLGRGCSLKDLPHNQLLQLFCVQPQSTWATENMEPSEGRAL